MTCCSPERGLCVVGPTGLAGGDSERWRVVPSRTAPGSSWTQLGRRGPVPGCPTQAVVYWSANDIDQPLIETSGRYFASRPPGCQPRRQRRGALWSVSWKRPSSYPAVVKRHRDRVPERGGWSSLGKACGRSSHHQIPLGRSTPSGIRRAFDVSETPRILLPSNREHAPGEYECRFHSQVRGDHGRRQRVLPLG